MNTLWAIFYYDGNDNHVMAVEDDIFSCPHGLTPEKLNLGEYCLINLVVRLPQPFDNVTVDSNEGDQVYFIIDFDSPLGLGAPLEIRKMSEL
jgi:hypothetical protein